MSGRFYLEFLSGTLQSRCECLCMFFGNHQGVPLLEHVCVC